MQRRKLLAAAALALSLFVLAPGAASAARHPGIDVSRFQGAIDWTLVAEEDKEFAYVQASRGDGGDCSVAVGRCGIDEYYDANREGAKAARIKVGAYHRAFVGGEDRSEIKFDARLEALVFIESVGEVKRGELRPALDLETPFEDLNPAELRIWTRTWLRKVTAAFGVKPIIYTNNTSWQALGNPTAFADAGHLLWVANWKVPEPLVPAANWAGKSWKIWQHSSTGKVAGIEGNVDLNVMRGGFGRLTIKAPGSDSAPTGGVG